MRWLPTLILLACAGGAAAAAPRILVFGTPHFAQAGTPFAEADVAAVRDGLTRYAPDMVAVEYLPASWPPGKGRDYRRPLDVDGYAAAWDMDAAAARRELARLRRDGAWSEASPCTVARYFLVLRDLANALYYWLGNGCPATADPAIAALLDARRGHEMARVAFPVARRLGLGSVVSIDYQGDDAAWFIDDLRDEAAAAGDQALLRQFQGLTEARASAGRRLASLGPDLTAQARYFNSPDWLGFQRRLYEHVLPAIRYRRAGRHQTDHYWLRNHRMFELIEAGQQEHGARRILVVVGAGHKYFLDELARDAGLRWVDPLDYLP